MRKRFYLLFILVICTACYGAFSIYKMLYKNRTLYTLECQGMLLDSNTVYAFSNLERQSLDTLFVNFEQAKVIMPTTLGFLYFDRARKEFLLKNNTCVFNPTTTKPDNYFLPFARTLHDGLFSKGQYFNGSEIISEEILITKGVKYNSAVGTTENRVSIELIKFGNRLYLKTKDDGIETKYLVQSNNKNIYDIVLNQPIKANAPNVFFFDNTTGISATDHLEITANTFSASYRIKDSTGNIIKSGTGSSSLFDIHGYLFSISPRYKVSFFILLTFFFIIIMVFQIYFLILYTKIGSPVIQALFSMRILLNGIVFLAMPIFLTAYHLAPGRQYYLLLVILLNLSFFFSKKILHNVDLNKHKSVITVIAWTVIIVAFLMMILFTRNESLFGVIPVLHLQKLIILLLIFATQIKFFKTHKYGHWLRFGFIIGCSLIISAITSDIGSFIYAGLALLLVELVRKTIKLRTAFIGLFCLLGTVYMLYNLFPEKFAGRKLYRVVAPYTNPASKNLLPANQSDRETYSTLLLNLKNVVEFKAPLFNDVVIPANMRSTCHSDFAFLWSFTFGGMTFLILFLVTAFALISNLVLLLFCSIRKVRIREGTTFILPSTREAELIRFLLAFTIISFIYPVASNTLLIPLTGQSIPCLSISNVEVIFLIWLIVSLSSIFTNEKYIVARSSITYHYGDARMSMKFALFFVGVSFMTAFIIRYISLNLLDTSMIWEKHIPDESLKINKQLPDYSDKAGLVDFAKTFVGKDNLVSVKNDKKPILKNLASLYYDGKPYSQTVFEPIVFSNSTERLLNQMSIDSIFDTRSKVISGIHNPFGIVYSFNQNVNDKQIAKVTNDYYNCIPPNAQSINADLTAECNHALQAHLQMIGVPGNIGSVMIVENNTGSVIANSSFPLISDINSNEVYYFIGSLKKLLIAYCALKINPSFRERTYGGKSFKEFVKNSDDFYAASLLRELLITNKVRLNEILTNDFDLPLCSLTEDAYFDVLPTQNDFAKKLDRNNSIYRIAIGQQKPYKFSQVVQFYTRVASGLKVELNYMNEERDYDHLSLNATDRDFLIECLNSVLYGTASVVRVGLEKNNIDTRSLICKTGTAQATSIKNGNSSSSFILSNSQYTIGVMLKGVIPDNNKKLAAKDLFVIMIPILKKYEILI